MSASNQHRRLSPVRACVLLIVVSLTVCTALFAEEKLPAQSGLSHSFSPSPHSTPLLTANVDHSWLADVAEIQRF